MYHFFELGTSLVDCFLVHILLQNWFGRRQLKPYIFFIGHLLFFSINVSYTLLPISPLFRVIISIFCVFVVSGTLYKTTFLSALAATAIHMILAVLAEYASMLLLQAASFDPDSLLSPGPHRVIYLAAAKLLHILVVLLATAILTHQPAKITLRQTAPLLICQLISLYVCEAFNELVTDVNFNEQISKFALILLGILAINLMMILSMQHLALADKHEQEHALEEQNYQLQKVYYESLHQNQQATHAMYHDIKKYMTAIEAMISSEHLSASNEALATLKNSFSNLEDLVDVENQELNILLHHYLQQAHARGFKVILDVYVPPQLSVSTLDLSIIIGNTFDNAIEACERCSLVSPVIHLRIKQHNNMLFYSMDNPCPDEPVKKSGLAHGYGLKNIKACIERYHGHMIAEQNGNCFHIAIRLNAPEIK